MKNWTETQYSDITNIEELKKAYLDYESDKALRNILLTIEESKAMLSCATAVPSAVLESAAKKLKRKLELNRKLLADYEKTRANLKRLKGLYEIDSGKNLV